MNDFQIVKIIGNDPSTDVRRLTIPDIYASLSYYIGLHMGFGSDDEIDKMQREIENICFGLLIQQQPVARDLRLITAAMKMVTDMERIGDHAVDISEMTEFLSVREMNDKFETLKLMASEATVMLIHSIDAFTEKSAEVAKDVIDHDDIVDTLFVNVKEELIKLVSDSPEEGEAGLDILMIAKYLERIGDHATNIAEWVLYSLDDKRE